jgi:hypothetical protein
LSYSKNARGGINNEKKPLKVWRKKGPSARVGNLKVRPIKQMTKVVWYGSSRPAKKDSCENIQVRVWGIDGKDDCF